MTMTTLTTERRCQWSFFLQLCVHVLRAVVFLCCLALFYNYITIITLELP